MSTGKGRVVRCQVEECSNQVAQKAYYQRYRICKHHSCLLSLKHGGKHQRWCQQCGRFQELSEFDGDKRTCRAKLSHHNLRRRAARSRNSYLSEGAGVLAEASSLHSDLSSWGAPSPAAACRAEHALPHGSQAQPGRGALPNPGPRARGEAPALQRDAAVQQRHQQEEEEAEEEEEQQNSSRLAASNGQPPLVLPPAPLAQHEAGQQQGLHQHTRKQQRQQLRWDQQGQTGQAVLRGDMPQQRQQQVEQQQQIKQQQAQSEPRRQAGHRVFLRLRVRQQHHLQQGPPLQGVKQPENVQQLQTQQQQQQQREGWSVHPLAPNQQEPPEQQWRQQPWVGASAAELEGQRLHSMHSGQSEGDSLPTQLAERARRSLGGQPQEQQPQALLAGGSGVGRGAATLARVHGQGPQDRPGTGYSPSTKASNNAIHGGQPPAGGRQPCFVPPASATLPHRPLGQADLAAMLSAPKRVCRLHAGAAQRESPFHVQGPAPSPAVTGQRPPPAAGPNPPAAPAPSLDTATAHTPAVTPLGARAGPQQKQQPPAVAASSKQASPGGTIDDLLELLSWGSHEESEPARVGPGGPWLSPPVLSIPLCSSPLGQARAPTPPFPDLLLPL